MICFLVNFNKTSGQNVIDFCKQSNIEVFAAILAETFFSWYLVLQKGSPFTILLGLVFAIYSEQKNRKTKFH